MIYFTKGETIGDLVVTTKKHKSLSGIIKIETGVKTYDIEDEHGNKMYEIGWKI